MTTGKVALVVENRFLKSASLNSKELRVSVFDRIFATLINTGSSIGKVQPVYISVDGVEKILSGQRLPLTMIGYYDRACFHIFAETLDGRRVQLVDGGSADWVGKILSSRKDQLFTSGIGAELVQKLFANKG